MDYNTIKDHRDPVYISKKEKWTIENAPPTKEEQRAAYKNLKNKKPKGFKPSRDLNLNSIHANKH